MRQLALRDLQIRRCYPKVDLQINFGLVGDPYQLHFPGKVLKQLESDRRLDSYTNHA